MNREVGPHACPWHPGLLEWHTQGLGMLGVYRAAPSIDAVTEQWSRRAELSLEVL